MADYIFEDLNTMKRRGFKGYQSANGYKALSRFMSGELPEEVIHILRESGLRGRGYGERLVWEKWESVRNATGEEKYLVINAAEQEIGSFKDRAVLEKDPHRLIEGAVIAGVMIGARRGVLFLKKEYARLADNFKSALSEARSKGFLGKGICKTDTEFDIVIRVSPAGVRTGEGGILLNVLEGKPPVPRFGTWSAETDGLHGRPTLIHNVETLAVIPDILRNGSNWFQRLGRGGSAGTKLFSLSGSISRPGIYELPLGTTLRELITSHGRDLPKGRTLQAFTLGGMAGGFLPAEFLKLPLNYDAPRKAGSVLGGGAVIVIDDRFCMVDLTRQAVSHLARENCGVCAPCRHGIPYLEELLEGMTKGTAAEDALEAFEKTVRMVSSFSPCTFGESVFRVTDSLNRYFRADLVAHARERNCPKLMCPLVEQAAAG